MGRNCNRFTSNEEHRNGERAALKFGEKLTAGVARVTVCEHKKVINEKTPSCPYIESQEKKMCMIKLDENNVTLGCV